MLQQSLKLSRVTLSLIFAWALTSFWATASAGQLPDFTDLVDEYGKAVVNISTIQSTTAKNPFDGMEGIEGTPFEEFFRHFFGEQGNMPQQEREHRSLGSGFLISDDGYVLTNFHVIKNAKKIIVKLTDRREFTAEVVGEDPESDLALLKFKGKNLPFVKLGSSKELKVGEWVVAIGSPFGFENSVTAGIVSAKGRSLRSERYVPFIQTDVAINPGNSGGPLFNMDGDVVGINAQILSRTGGYMGVSFAIPADVAQDVVNQLKGNGKVERGWLGIAFQEVTRDLAESFGLEDVKGALVASVIEDSPADKAGVKPGDILVKYNNETLSDAAELPHMVGRTKVGVKVPLTVFRDGKEKNLKVKIAELPADYDKAESKGNKKSEMNKLGLLLRDLKTEERKRADVKKGVLVTRVAPGPARSAGLRRGDIVLSMNREEIKDLEHFEKVMEALPEETPIPVLVKRRGHGQRYFAIELEKSDNEGDS